MTFRTLLSTVLLASALPVIGSAATLDDSIAALQNDWARIKYKVSDDATKLTELRALEERAAGVAASYPGPEAQIWQAIILATDAGVTNGITALPKLKKARGLLEAALAQNPAALDGSAHTSLGSLYYQVPGWPISFGDDDKAESHLQAALKINPAGIDPNYFYGDFLLQNDRAAEARTYLERALKAPPRPGRDLADAGRRQEIKADLAKLN